MEFEPELSACNFVIFGGSGDLATRKLLPALYSLDQAGLLHPDSRVVGVSRSDLSDDSFREVVQQGLNRYLPAGSLDAQLWERFARRLSYASVDVMQADSMHALKQVLGESFNAQTTIYYLSMPPALFGATCDVLRQQQLVREDSRLVIEKPIGHDQQSSGEINAAVGEVFAEPQIYRIDHYLGKETVQNLLALRFANVLFEPLWNRTHIDNVQITVAESVGIEGRWDYYDDFGALRDMVQNHLLQLVCLLAMGVPVSMDPEAVRAEKLKVLKSLKIMTPEEVSINAVRGQYGKGVIDGNEVVGYREEPGGRPDSETETFVALRADIHNWRWRGVPFYLRTGKRLPSRFSEIVIQFRDVPHSIFSESADLQPNKLVLRLQPEESIKLFKMNKVPGLSAGMRMTPVSLNLTLPERITAARVPDAYERLIYDVMRGDATLFVNREEVEMAWRWVDAIIQGWSATPKAPASYPAGSWGPQAAFELVARYGHAWHESH